MVLAYCKPVHASESMSVTQLIASLAFEKQSVFRSQLSSQQKAEKIADIMHELLILQERSCRSSVSWLASERYNLCYGREISEEMSQVDSAIDRVPEEFWNLVSIAELNFYFDQGDFSSVCPKSFVSRLASNILENISNEDIDETYKDIKFLLRTLRLRRSYTYPR